jgi:glycosyltransferase involved in cell wall biosynthesis
VEPDRVNVEMAAENLEQFIEDGSVRLTRAAAWRSDPNDDELRFDGYHPFPKSFTGMEGVVNTGNGSVIWGEGEVVPKLAFDEVVDLATNNGEKRVRLLKLDCEGAEWPILLTSQRLHLIDEICGEFHEIGGQFLEISEDRGPSKPIFRDERLAEFTAEGLVQLLNDAGFAVTYRRHRRPTGAVEGLGLFFATRVGSPTVREGLGLVSQALPHGRATDTHVKLIAIGYNISGTGLTRVMHSILRRLAGRHEIHYLGIGYQGEPIRDRNLTIYPTNPRGGDVFAAFQAKRMIEELDPALVFILHDIWLFEHYLKILGPYRDRLKIAGYIPLDGCVTSEEVAAPLEQADRVVVYTEFARAQIEGAFHRLREKRGLGLFPKVEVIPHGVDRDRFAPFPELLEAGFASAGRAQAKKKVFGDLDDLEESFVVLNASRPDKRKRIDLTIEGFARFAAGKPSNVRLCLHHAILGEPERRQIESLVRQFEIEERVYLNPLAGGVVGDDELNLLYNACDVGINTSMGEGWGLVSFEHAATGAAQIVPDHTACGEIWSGRGELIPTARSFVPEFSVLEMGEVSAGGVAQALENVYRDPRRRQELSQAAFAMAQKTEYSWDAVAQQFGDLFVAMAK